MRLPIASRSHVKRNASTQELRRRVAQDLERIPMKALRSDPKERYATVIGLLNDVRRSMSNLPIKARPPSRLYSFQKFFRRNRLAVVAASATILAFVSQPSSAPIMPPWHDKPVRRKENYEFILTNSVQRLRNQNAWRSKGRRKPKNAHTSLICN